MGNRFSHQLAEAEAEDGDDAAETQNGAPAAKPARRTAGSAETREAPAPRRNAAPKAPKGKQAADSDDQPALSIMVGSAVIPIPPGTPLYKRTLAVVEALYAD